VNAIRACVAAERQRDDAAAEIAQDADALRALGFDGRDEGD
jgi:hypothetical protein